MEAKNGNGSKNTYGILPNMISTAVVLLTMFAGFWSLADPRQSISELKSNFANYLTLREHDQYKQDLIHQLSVLSTGFENVQKEQLIRSGSIEHIHALEKQIDELKKSHDELAKEVNSSVTIADRMKELQNEINSLRERLLSPVNTTKEVK